LDRRELNEIGWIEGARVDYLPLTPDLETGVCYTYRDTAGLLRGTCGERATGGDAVDFVLRAPTRGISSMASGMYAVQKIEKKIMICLCCHHCILNGGVLG
jgi:hypothetical protein